MLCCCECLLNLGCIDVCSMLDTGILAPVSESEILPAKIFTLKVKFNGSLYTIASPLTGPGDPILFNIRDLIPNFTYNGIILDDQGESLPLVKDDISYDCLSFQTQITVN